MIAKAKSIEHGRNSINYALNKKGAEVINKILIVGNTGGQIKNEFKIFQRLNHRCTKNDLSFVLSPEPSDGRKLTNRDYEDISKDFLKKMGLEDHQSITIKHNDTEVKHLHIYVNRVNSNGKAYKDGRISIKSQDIADQIALEKNLIRAKKVEENRMKNTKAIRAEIFSIHKSVLVKRPKNGKAYRTLMQEKNVKIIPTINKAGKAQGFRVEYKGQNFKASEVHRSMSIGNLKKELNKISESINSQRNSSKPLSSPNQSQQRGLKHNPTEYKRNIGKSIENEIIKPGLNIGSQECDEPIPIVYTAPRKKKKKRKGRSKF